MPKKTTHVRVGLFVAVALAVLIVTVFVIGQERSMFTSKTRLYTSFTDINGLVEGAPVRLAGVDVGRVKAIAFADDLERPEARVELAIENRYMTRVRRDSRAYIDSKGLLGDKIINLTVGSSSAPRLEDGDFVTPGQGVSLEALAKRVEGTATAIGDAALAAQGAVGNLASPEITENVRRITDALASVLEEVQYGDGIAHQVVYDPVSADQVAAIFANLADASAKARSAAGRFDGALARVERGPGTLNALVYGEQGAEALVEWRRAGAGVAELADQLNHGDGLAPALLHDEAGRTLVRDLTEFTSRLNRLSRDVERGRGTLGGLMVDPSIYEDMKTVLGNIERNVLFKALIRMTIKEDDIQRPAKQARPAGGL